MATKAQRELAAAIGSLTRWSRVHGHEARARELAPANNGRTRKLERQACEEAGRELPPAELAEAVDRLRRAHYRRMALASSRSRQRNNNA